MVVIIYIESSSPSKMYIQGVPTSLNYTHHPAQVSILVWLFSIITAKYSHWVIFLKIILLSNDYCLQGLVLLLLPHDTFIQHV